jgi:hypothetical protein
MEAQELEKLSRALAAQQRALAARRVLAPEPSAPESERAALAAEYLELAAEQNALELERARLQYARLCLADACSRLLALLHGECRARGRAVAEPILLLCARRIGATKYHYWTDVAQFASVLDTPCEGFCGPVEDEGFGPYEGLRARVLRFVEIFVLAAALGQRVGSWTLLAKFPRLPLFACRYISDVGEAFGRALALLTDLANAGPVRPSASDQLECDLLGVLCVV